MGREVKVTAEFFERLKEQGSAWLVMEGEPSPECAKNWPDAVSGDYNPACCRFPKSCSADVLFAPAELVAAAAPCETCGGVRTWGDVDRPNEALPCGDCRVSLVGPCPNDTDGDGDCAWCSRPGNFHVVGHAYAATEDDVNIPGSYVVPIVKGPIPWPREFTACIVVMEEDGQAWLHYGPMPNDPELTLAEDITDVLAHYGDLRALVGKYAMKLGLA